MSETTTIYTISQAATALGLNRNTLLRQINRGVLHGTRLGSVWIISAAERERYRHTHLGKHGTASPDHPLPGRRGGTRGR